MVLLSRGSIQHRDRPRVRFAGLRTARDQRVKQPGPEQNTQVKEIRRHQVAGEGMQYSMHTCREIQWRLNFTPDVDATRARIADLSQSLAQPTGQKLAAEQQASDGTWGRGFTIWYLKLYYSVENGLNDSHRDLQYSLSVLDQIHTPEMLTQATRRGPKQ